MVYTEENAMHNVKQGNSREYREPKSHNHVKSNPQRDVYMVSQADNKICLSSTHQNKQVNVTLEFPEQSDQKAEQEFISRLKAAYLKKIEIGAIQKGDLALQSPTTKDKEEKNNE